MAFQNLAKGVIKITIKRNRVNESIENLLKYISENHLNIGDKLPKESELAEILNVGRSTLREAVKILVFSNVLDVKQGSGTFIKNNRLNEQVTTSHLIEAREMIETKAVELICKNGYKIEEMLELKETLFKRNQLLSTGKFSEYVDVDILFHKQIIELCQNPLLLKWYEELVGDLKVFLSEQILKTSNYEDNTKIHNELYQALIDKDVGKARKMIKQNIKT